MSNSELVKELRTRPYRLGTENEDEARERRQRERELAADTIERLEREKAEAFDRGMRQAALIVGCHEFILGSGPDEAAVREQSVAAILAAAEKGEKK